MSTIVTTQPRHIMRLPKVMAATGLGRAWIYQLMADGKFPKAHKIGLRAVGWNSQEIEAWIAKQLGEVRA
nr:AlpA family transcriptional regulator [Pseudomonas sp.]